MKFYSLAGRNAKEIYRDPVSLLLGLFLPLSMLMLFTAIEKKVPLELFSPQSLTPGIIVFSFTFMIMFSATLIAKDKNSSFLIRMFTTPLKPKDYILSYILPFVPLIFLQIVICIVTGTILGASFSNLLVSLLPLMLIALSCVFLGLILGSLFTVNQISGIGSILITAIGLVSNVWMDVKMVGGSIESIAYSLPFVHAVDASKKILSGSTLGEVNNNIIVICIYAIILFVIAVFSFKQTMKRI